MLIAIYLNSV